MGVEQAIFTACDNGITRKGAGFQIYSYSSGIKRLLEETDAALLFQYEPPNFERIPIQEKLSLRNYPRKFAYRIVEKERNLVCMASNKMVEQGRFGNYFSHILVTNLLSVKGYPCEYYKSPLFAEGLSEEQQKKRTKPDLLYKATFLEPGLEITYESVRSFLQEENRIVKLKNLLSCLLAGREESEQKKLVLIDTNTEGCNHIIYWIAAITMALPKQIAKNLSFSDYEYDAAGSEFRICGTIKNGTRYDKVLNNKNVALFDFETNHCPYQKGSNELLDVMELSYKVSADCIAPFFEFIEKYTYNDCDERLYDAYELYKIRTIPEYITKITKQKLHRALAFGSAYGKEEEKNSLIVQLLSFLQQSKLAENRVLCELCSFFVVQQKENRLDGKRIALPLLQQLYEALAVSTKEGDRYSSLLKEFTYYFGQMEMSVHRYFLGVLPIRQMELMIRKTSYEWKIDAAIHILKEYLLEVKPTVNELAEDERFNRILHSILLRCEQGCPSGKKMEYYRVMQEFSYHYAYETYLYLFIERNLETINGLPREKNIVQKTYASYFATIPKEKKCSIYEYLLLESNSTIVMLFHYASSDCENFEEWFSSVSDFVLQYELARGELLDQLMQECFEQAVAERANRYESVLILFQFCFKIGYRDRFLNRLVPYLSASLPLIVTKTEQVSLLKKLYYYQVNFNGGMIEKRVALCYRFYELNEFLEAKPKRREKIQFQKPILLPTMDGVETSNYIKRVGGVIGEILYRNGQVNLMKDCYKLTKPQQDSLYKEIFEVLLKRGKRKRDYMPFLHAFVFTVEEDVTEEMAEAIRSSGTRVQELTKQLQINMPHLVACQKLYGQSAGGEEKIARKWNGIIRRIIKAE